jgi:methylthioxylose transferase
VLAGTVVGAAVCCAVATEALLLGSPRGRWHYRYVQPLAITPFLVALGVSVPVLALLRIRARSAAGEWSLVVAWIVLATAAHAALRSLTLFSFESIFTSPGANSFYTVTLQQPLSAVLSSFVQARDAMPLHAQSNMPGKLVLMYGLEVVTVSPVVLPWIVVMLSNLGALLMYRFVRRLVEDHTTALYSAVLYLFVPAKLFFFPLMNTITPVIALALGCLIVEWLKTGRLLWAVAVGVLLYVVVFFEPLPLVLGLLFAGLAFRAVCRGDLGWSRLVSHSVAALAAFVACAVLVQQVWGFDLINGFRAVRAHALEFNAIERRPYDIWVRANLVEFFFGLGPCQTVLITGALVLGLRGPDTLGDRLTRPVPLVTLGLLAAVAAIDLIGINRGEVIRLWIFLACFLQIPAAWVCAETGRPQAIALVIITTLLVCALGTANIGFVVPA